LIHFVITITQSAQAVRKLSNPNVHSKDKVSLRSLSGARVGGAGGESAPPNVLIC